MTDQQLLLQFITRRDDSAFRQLVDRHTPWLYSVCLRRLRDPALAEDATQAVFLALAQKAPTLLHEPTLSPWLHQVAKFVAANLLRARSRRTRHESEAAAMTPTHSPAPQWQDIESDLEPALDRLPFADRQMLLLRFYEHKSHPEIAALLNISEAAAAKRLERALARLRSHLAPTSANFSTAALASLLRTHAILPVPAAVVASTAAASTATLAKGALIAMATAKLQTALVVIAACLLIVIPATVIVLHRETSAPIPPLAAAPAATAPDDFLACYSLQPDEALKLVTDAPIEARTAFLADGDPTRQPPPQGKFITILWRGDHPYLWGYGDGVPLLNILEVYMNVYAPTLNATLPLPPNTPNTFINWNHTAALPSLLGDLVIRQSATPEQYRASLESLLTKSLGRPITLTFRDVTEKALVLRGSWQYTPNSPHAPARVGGIPVLEIFGPSLDQNLNQGITANGPKDYFAGHLGAWLNQPVLIESDNFPTVSAHFNTDFVNDPQSHDKTLVLNHLTAQTGLTWSEETRTVRHLFIEPAPAPPPARDPFAQIYAPAPGEFVKHIPNAPAELRNPFIRERFGASGSRASLFLGWSNDTLGAYGFYGARRYSLAALASQILGLESLEVEGNLANRTITGGDFSFSQDPATTPEQLRAALQKILQDDFQLPVSLQFRDVPQKVIVLRGKWKFTPTPGVPTTNSPTGPLGLPIPCIDIYGGDSFDKNSTQSASGSGPSRSLATTLSDWINQQVFIEATGFPLLFGYRCHETRSTDPETTALAHDRDSVLKHITEQTALTWTEETRTLHHLFIESTPTP